MDTIDNDGAAAPASIAPRADASPPDAMTLELRVPIAGVEGTITKVELREPRVSDLLTASAPGRVAPDVMLVATAAMMIPIDVEKMAVSDFKRANAFVDSFFEPGAPPEGEPPSSITIDLREPVTTIVDGEQRTCSSYILHEPTVAEWKKMDRESGVKRDVEALKIVANLPIEIIREMRVSDLARGAQYLARFFG